MFCALYFKRVVQVLSHTHQIALKNHLRWEKDEEHWFVAFLLCVFGFFFLNKQNTKPTHFVPGCQMSLKRGWNSEKSGSVFCWSRMFALPTSF